ncbi:DUF2909 domain-containing protein [Vibrio sp. Of7-15]|uniref:DUF2909 family protein n=1 Tax=Vibrio sp. Of7-15 TaxID=2724879 RepID=UPI001EF25126|nr:DUF2909 family protein [Vibrio sp. Of7-15]MCG7498927.1 DUF2909 domain-containing protein [Vibrio sp. Of7-15]
MILLLKTLLVFLLGFIIFNLFRALPILLKGPKKDSADTPQTMSSFLGRRVLLSAVVFILLLIGLSSGLITPHLRPY